MCALPDISQTMALKIIMQAPGKRESKAKVCPMQRTWGQVVLKRKHSYLVHKTHCIGLDCIEQLKRSPLKMAVLSVESRLIR